MKGHIMGLTPRDCIRTTTGTLLPVSVLSNKRSKAIKQRCVESTSVSPLLTLGFPKITGTS